MRYEWVIGMLYALLILFPMSTVSYKHQFNGIELFFLATNPCVFFFFPQTGIKLFLHYGDLTDSTNLFHIVSTVRPHELYNLGAMSHVAVGWKECLSLLQQCSVLFLSVHVALAVAIGLCCEVKDAFVSYVRPFPQPGTSVTHSLLM